MARPERKQRIQSIFTAPGFWNSIVLTLTILRLNILAQSETILINSIDVLKPIETNPFDLRLRFTNHKRK